MIRYILQSLLIFLNYDDTPVPKNSLHRQQTETFTFNISPVGLIILFFTGITIFAILVFLFMPGTESGVVYNNSLY